MTEKQEKILDAALTLFAENGYDSTSTSKVAKAAGVSEGLIFRHFENKEGLLNAIMEQGKQKSASLYATVMLQDNPKKLLKTVIELIFNVDKRDYPFWKLMYALKWRADVYDESMSAPLKAILTDAFKKLDYKNPEAEADVILIFFDGLATNLILKKPKNQELLKESILSKYDL